jgi:hypothetical protein
MLRLNRRPRWSEKVGFPGAIEPRMPSVPPTTLSDVIPTQESRHRHEQIGVGVERRRSVHRAVILGRRCHLQESPARPGSKGSSQ